MRKNWLVFLLMTFAISRKAMALSDADICVTNISGDWRNKNDLVAAWDGFRGCLTTGCQLDSWDSLECKKRTEIAAFFEGYSVFLAGLTLSCSLAPHQLTTGVVLVLGVSSSIMGVVQFVTKQLPCSGPSPLSPDQELEVEKIVCRQMAKTHVVDRVDGNKCI